MTKLKAIFIGECMVELSAVENGLLQKSFAGDVFNSAVYMKRIIQDRCDVSVLTAIGKDKISCEMEAFFKHHGLETSTVLKSSGGTVGLYLISTDYEGERSFSYWRENSLARRLMTILEKEKIKICDYQADLIFFTGISLAILDKESREKLLMQLKTARENGAQLAFDPNYRHQLWENKQEAVDWIEEAYQISDFIFPSLDEENSLFSTQSVEDCLHRFTQYEGAEIILKAGDKGMYVKSGQEIIHLQFTPADKVVDTTAAGDAFDGTYLAMRLNNENIKESATKAASVAAKVVTYPGAIVPEALTR